MSALEQQILEKFRQLDEDEQRRVLAFMQHLEQPAASDEP